MVGWHGLRDKNKAHRQLAGAGMCLWLVLWASLFLVCRLNVDAFAFDFGIAHGLQDFLAIFPWDFYERILVIHVDCPHEPARDAGFPSDGA